MDSSTYLFIDGRYLRDIFRRAMQEVFAVATEGEMDLALIRHTASAQKVFYYDCLNDLQNKEEIDSKFEARVQAQQRMFASIRALYGFHVQLGTLKGGHKRREQKEVDVLLAVEMLTHAFNRNMSRAVLLAGDLDFRPIIEALIRLGIFVEVWYEKKSAAKDLYDSADYGREITWNELYGWGIIEFKAAHSVPVQTNFHSSPLDPTVLHLGLINDQQVSVVRERGGKMNILRFESRYDGVVWMEHEDQGVLERYLSMRYGPVEWKSPGEA